MTELKPCPFCGGEGKPNRHFWHVVFCLTCQAEGPGSHTRAQAIAAWNTRASEKE